MKASVFSYHVFFAEGSCHARGSVALSEKHQ